MEKTRNKLVMILFLGVISNVCYSQIPENKNRSIVAIAETPTKVVMNNGLLFEVKYDPAIGHYISVSVDSSKYIITPSKANYLQFNNNEVSKNKTP